MVTLSNTRGGVATSLNNYRKYMNPFTSSNMLVGKEDSVSKKYLSVLRVLNSTRRTPLGIFKDFITSAASTVTRNQRT